MRSIIMKDLFQARWGILFAIAISLALFLLHGGDRDLIFGINFGIIAPMFMWIITHNSLSGERSAGTYHFLMSLPLSRSRVWKGKALASLLIGLICTVALYLLSVITGMPLWPEGYRVFDLNFSPQLLFVLLPLLAWAAGIMTTVLHPVPSAVTAIGLTWALGFQGFRQETIAQINWVPYILFALIIFIVSSYLHFRNQPDESSRKFLWFSFRHLLAATAIFLLSILTLNQYHEWANRNLRPFGYLAVKKMTDNGKYLLFAQANNSSFDSIANRTSFDLRMFDHKKSQLSPLANRHFLETAFDSECNNCMYETDLGPLSPGTTRLILQDIKAGTTEVIDEYAKPIGFTSNGQALYTRLAYADDPEKAISRSFIFESSQKMYQSLRRYDRSKRTSYLIATFPADVDFYSHLNKDYNCALAINRGNIWLIDCNQVSIKKLDLNLDKMTDYYVSKPWHDSEAIILRCSLRSDYDNKIYFVISPTGKITRLQAEQGRLISAHKNGMALLRQNVDATDENSKVVLLREDGSESELNFDQQHLRNVCFSTSGRYLATLGWEKGEETIWRLQVRDLQNPDKIWEVKDQIPVTIWPHQQDSFEFDAGHSICRIDSSDFTRVIPLFNAKAIMGKEESNDQD